MAIEYYISQYLMKKAFLNQLVRVHVQSVYMFKALGWQ